MPFHEPKTTTTTKTSLVHGEISDECRSATHQVFERSTNLSDFLLDLFQQAF